MKRQSRVFMGIFSVVFLLSVLIVYGVDSDNAISVKKFQIVKKPLSQVVKTRTATSSRSAIPGVEWTELRLEFKTTPEWIDEMNIKCYARVQGKNDREGTILFGEVTYVNVPRWKYHAASLFVHPTTLARYGQVENVHCEIWAKGKLRDTVDWPQKTSRKWWEMKAPVKGSILTKFYTPFAFSADYDGLAVKTE
jgi:hypothetical protein